MVSLKWSADRKALYALLSAKQARYELQAELMGMEFELQPRYGGGFMPFVRSNKSVFLRAYNDEFFTTTQRQAILKDIISQSSFRGGAGISIHKCIRSGIFAKWFPFHSEQTRRFFAQSWATWKVWKWCSPQPLDQMQAYFGEELTLYFAWLGFYNFALIGPALIGLGVFIAVIVLTQTHEADEIGEMGLPNGARANYAAGVLNTVYAVLLMIWVTVYLEFWKRYNAELAFKWNMLDFEVSERSRPEYRGDIILGVHNRGEWIPFDKDDETLKRVHVVPTIYSDPKKTKFKLGVSIMPLITILVVVVIIVLAVLALRLFLQKEVGAGAGGIIGSIIGAVLIIVFNVLYGKLAVVLADWENHRTDTEYQDSLITKTFLFQFVNTFASLYYIAFGKRANDFSELVSGIAKRAPLRDKCKSRFMDERGEYLQYVNQQWFERLGWTPMYTRGVDKPGTLAAFDNTTNITWDYVRWDVSLADMPIFFTDPATGIVSEKAPTGTIASFDGQSFDANITVAEYFVKIAATTFSPLSSATIDPESNDYFRPNSASLAALNQTDDGAVAALQGRVRDLVLTDYLRRFEGESAQVLADESASFLLTFHANASDFWVGAISQRQLGAGCMSELVIQLATLMLVNLAVGQAKEILLPLLMVQVKKALVAMNIKKMEEDVTDDLKRPWEVQAKLVEFMGTFDEYAEMVIQFCLVVAFAAAFPLAPLLALANNITEVRTDAIKIVFTNNKPHYKGAEDIGGWYRILEIIGYIAVITNTLLILLGFSVLPIAVHGGMENAHPDLPPAPSLPLRCFIYAILLEHAVFLLKYALAEVVPDMPPEVRQNLARREFLKDELQGELDHRPHFRPLSKVKSEEAGRVFSYDTDSQYVDPDSGAGRVVGQNIILGADLEHIVVAAEDANYDAVATTADTNRKRAKKERRDKQRLASNANTADTARAVAAVDGRPKSPRGATPKDDEIPPPPPDPDAQ
jgi:hypothetical protein